MTTKTLKEQFFEELHRMEKDPRINLKKITVWDVAVNVLNPDTLYLVTLKADMLIIRLIAKGLSISSIANILGIASLDVIKVARTWGLTPLKFTLDFNPLLVYNKGMTPDTLLSAINDILPLPLDRETAINIIDNIEKYHDLMEFIEEEDE